MNKLLSIIPLSYAGTFWPAMGLAKAFGEIPDIDQGLLLSDNIIKDATIHFKNAIVEFKPDLVVVISYSVVNREALQFARERGVKVVYWLLDDYRYRNSDANAVEFASILGTVDILLTFQDNDRFIETVASRYPGIKSAYLPLGCDQGFFNKLNITKDKEIVFCGSPYPNRIRVLNEICDDRFIIYGKWKKSNICNYITDTEQKQNILNQINNNSIVSLKPSEENIAYNSAKICLNIHSSLISSMFDFGGDNLNPRTFNIAGAGGFQLVDNRSPLAKAFVPDKEVTVYNSMEELKYKLDYYLKHQDEAELIAKAGYTRVLKEHMFKHRAQVILEMI